MYWEIVDKNRFLSSELKCFSFFLAWKQKQGTMESILLRREASLNSICWGWLRLCIYTQPIFGVATPKRTKTKNSECEFLLNQHITRIFIIIVLMSHSLKTNFLFLNCSMSKNTQKREQKTISHQNEHKTTATTQKKNLHVPTNPFWRRNVVLRFKCEKASAVALWAFNRWIIVRPFMIFILWHECVCFCIVLINERYHGIFSTFAPFFSFSLLSVSLFLSPSIQLCECENWTHYNELYFIPWHILFYFVLYFLLYIFSLFAHKGDWMKS